MCDDFWRREMLRVLPRNKEFEVKELREEIERLKALIEELRELNALLQEREEET